MKKITASERAILDRVLFAETFDTLLEETQLKRGALRDDLMNLLNNGYLETYDTQPDGSRKVRFYDTDHLENYAFRATRAGLNALKA